MYNQRSQRAKGLRFAISGCFLCTAAIVSIFTARSLFVKKPVSPFSITEESSSFKPSDLSGMYFNGKESLKTSFSYDSPFLSILFWMKPTETDNENDMMIVGNRELSCSAQQKTSGYAVFYNYKNKTIGVMWKSRRSRCEVLLAPLTEENILWTHIAVVFRPFETEVDVEHLNAGAYPMIVELYINGKLAATKTQMRFFSDNMDKISIGGSRKNESPYKGRIFMLMVLKAQFTQNDIQHIYDGGHLAMDSYFNAVMAYGFQHSLHVCTNILF